MRRSKQIDVRRALALAGLFHFLLGCSRCCLLPFLTLLLRRLGLPASMVGVVLGSKHLVTAAWSPASSLLFKLYNKRRPAIGCGLALSAALPLLLLLLPTLTSDPSHLTAACLLSNASEASTPQADRGVLAVTAAGPAATAGTTDSQSDITASVKVHQSDATASVKVHQSDATASVKVHQSDATASVKVHQSDATASVKVHQSDATASVKVHQSDASSTAGTSRTWLQSRSTSWQENTSHSPKSVASPGRRRRSLTESAPHRGEQEEEEAEPGSYFLSSLKAVDPQHQLFFLVLITVFLWEVASASVDWTADDGLYEYLDYADASDRYDGSGRWGLLGGACGALGAGLLVSRLSCLPAAGSAFFYCYACVAAAALPLAARLPLHLNRKRDRAAGLLRALRLVRGSPRALLCALSALLAGAAGSAVSDFLLWQMQERGSGELHMGLALALGLLSQAAFPLLAGPLSRLLGPSRLLALGLASLAAQCFYYSLLWGPWAALPAQTLSCFSSGALCWALRVQCEDVATPGAERSVRRVCGALALHLGNGLGSFAGGAVVQRFGVTWLFVGAAASLTLWCVCLALLQWKTPQQRRINYSRLLAADGSEASDSDSEQEKDWLDKAMEVDRSNNNGEWRRNR